MCEHTPALDIWKIKDKGDAYASLWPFLAAVEALQALKFTNVSPKPSIAGSVTFDITGEGENPISCTVTAVEPIGFTVTKAKVTLKEGVKKTVAKVPQQRITNSIVIGVGTISPAVEGEFRQIKANDSTWRWRPWWMCDSDNLWPECFQSDNEPRIIHRNGIYANDNDIEPLLIRDFLGHVKNISNARVSFDCPLLGNKVGSIAELLQKGNKKADRVIISSSISVDHLIPTAVCTRKSRINYGNNKLPCSAEANKIKEHWIPTDVNKWTSREKYIGAIKSHLNNEFFANRKHKARAEKISNWLWPKTKPATKTPSS